MRSSVEDLISTHQLDAARPELAVDRARFARFVAARLAPGEDASALHLIDLYLVCACLDHDARALVAFEREQLAPVAGYIARIDRSPAFVDDVRQTLRARLIVDVDGRGARLSRYSGRGTLAAWMRVCAVRTALNLRRAPTGELEAANDAVAADDPERRLLVARLGPHVRDAFAGALAALADAERTLLREHFIEDRSFTQLERAYGFERSTIARRVAAARQRLRDDTAARLRQRLRLDAGDAESLLCELQPETFFSTIDGSLCLSSGGDPCSLAPSSACSPPSSRVAVPPSIPSPPTMTPPRSHRRRCTRSVAPRRSRPTRPARTSTITAVPSCPTFACTRSSGADRSNSKRS